MPSRIAAFKSWAVFDTRTFFIILARWASTVLTLIFNCWAISLFLNPDQMRWRISSSRLVKFSGRFRRDRGVVIRFSKFQQALSLFTEGASRMLWVEPQRANM